MLGLLIAINGLFDQIRSAAASGQSTSESKFRKTSKTSLEYVTPTFADTDKTTDKMTDKLDATNRRAKFEVGFSSGESLDSLNNLRVDDQQQQKASTNKNCVDKNKTSEQGSKRRVVTHRKKRHKTDKEKCSGILEHILKIIQKFSEIQNIIF